MSNETTADDGSASNLRHHAICPDCVSVSSKDHEPDAQAVVRDHNEARHDGDDVARVVGPHPEDLNEFHEQIKEEFDWETVDEVTRLIVNADPWGVLS
ncbi:hypothetical protein Hbl1158_17105 (plasmid) [Halobaculum sp. CBA1158]|uniref:hypothetical protein n=1 Tax=Halobaculum sp. CBA1158 TaxID=2904243 RepID=UPI001F29916E|nr:hypothetical protein [Halobaculum sp. CBA1158]UIP01721.1 hypothetical protein Hbl1158_17105 [Halobaculum sp. CBA1158]